MTPGCSTRRRFLGQTTAGIGALAATLASGCGRRPKPDFWGSAEARALARQNRPKVRHPYKGPNVIIVRFGGGVRREDTIRDPARTYCPFIYHKLYREQGILLNNVEIEDRPGVETNHAQCTLYMITGNYDYYEDVACKPFEYRFEPSHPTVFEYFRRHYAIPSHQALIFNCEDRINEEFYNYSNHHLFGVYYRSETLSLYRFKTWLTQQDLEKSDLGDAERRAKEQELRHLQYLDYRTRGQEPFSPPVAQFWERWRDYYGRTGRVHPRGDRVLTAMALRAMFELRPRLLMLNYCDPDYVHWGPHSCYRRAVAVIDEGVERIWRAAQADGGDRHGHTYRNNTVFLVMPDCGRDNNRCMAVPYQHHFGSKTAHQTFLVAAGPGIARPGRVVDRAHTQISLAATVGQIMQFPTPHVDAPAFEEVLA